MIFTQAQLLNLALIIFLFSYLGLFSSPYITTGQIFPGATKLMSYLLI